MIIGEFNDTYPPELDGVGTVVKSYAEELTAMVKKVENKDG